MTSILSRKGSMQSAHQQVTLPYGAAQPASPIESSSSPPSPVFGSTSDTRSEHSMRRKNAESQSSRMRRMNITKGETLAAQSQFASSLNERVLCRMGRSLKIMRTQDC
eukprot:6092400-Amphidinium_carterae.2